MEKTIRIAILSFAKSPVENNLEKKQSIFAYLSENCTSSSFPSIHAHCFLSTVSSDPSITNFSLFHDESWEQKAKEKAAFDRAANFQLSNPFIARFFRIAPFLLVKLADLEKVN